MSAERHYREQGYAHIERLIPPDVATALLGRVQQDLAQSGQPMTAFSQSSPLMKKSAIEIYSHHYPPLLTFLWGLTPMMNALTGRDLLPTYDYFRVYQRGDICRLHSDRPSCEHSLSLTLGYSDERIWNFEIGKEPVEGPEYLKESFGETPHTSIGMKPGDAVLYQGVQYRHGRVSPNPNRWSAHLFLHWVDREGPHKEHAFDKAAGQAGAIDFRFG